MTAVRVSTPSRLHFGLLRLHEHEGRSFGGLGMMIDQPRVELELAAATEWQVSGPTAKRAAAFAEQALVALPVAEKPAALWIRVSSHVPSHRGLGGGTQLALAIAAGVRALIGLPPASAAELAQAAGRGARSAVGSHGFVHGGLIWERGRVGEDAISELTQRVPIPESWRIVLVAPPRGEGLSGMTEHEAFKRLPAAPTTATRRLETLAEDRILPAARSAAVDEFGDAVYEYGRLSGELFAVVQGGPYASAEIAECVAALRASGVRGVGQSSWGPTVFAVTAGQEAAEDLTARLRGDRRWAEHEIVVAGPDNRGADVTTTPVAEFLRNSVGSFGETALRGGETSRRHSNP